MILHGDHVTLRPVREDDVAALLAIRAEPEVFVRWGEFDEAEIRDDFVGSDQAFVVEVDGRVGGAIQYGEENEPMYRHASVDIFLGEEFRGRRLGTEAILLLARHLFEERGHHRLTIDPAADNHGAIRAYARAGFRPVGVMRNYERGPDGIWHDGLLMDLLVEEFSPSAAGRESG